MYFHVFMDQIKLLLLLLLVVHGGVVDGSVMEWIGGGGSTGWGGRRVCHGVDRGRGVVYLVGWSTGLSWSG